MVSQDNETTVRWYSSKHHSQAGLKSTPQKMVDFVKDNRGNVRLCLSLQLWKSQRAVGVIQAKNSTQLLCSWILDI